jgi:hypothetical protein
MAEYIKKSGRVEPDRPGYSGYECDGSVDRIFIECMDCGPSTPCIPGPLTNCGNRYKRVPNSFPSTVTKIKWIDYSLSPGGVVPSAWSHECSDTYHGVPVGPVYTGGGFLEVEYPDVPPVSTRGITLKSTRNWKSWEVCYEPFWLDPANIDPHTSKGYSNASTRQRRWYYVWWPPGTAPRYSDDNPARKGDDITSDDVKASWLVSAPSVDLAHYNILTANPLMDKVVFNYCEECPKEEYTGPFAVYLNRNISDSRILRVEEGHIIRSGSPNLTIPVNYINTEGTTEEVYLYYDVTESTQVYTLYKSLVSDGYPTLSGATSDHYYIVLAKTVADDTGDLGCAYDFAQITQIQHGEYIKAGSASAYTPSIPCLIQSGFGGMYNVALYANGIGNPSTGTGQLLVLNMYVNDTIPSGTWMIATPSTLVVTGGG